MTKYEELCKKKIGDMNEGELYVFAQGLLDEVWKLEDKIDELENINGKISLALESAESKLDKTKTYIEGNVICMKNGDLLVSLNIDEVLKAINGDK